MNIVIEFIPHARQRYDTVGDWYYNGYGILCIKVSNDHTGYLDPKLQEAVALHELTEALLCAHAGVTQKMVDDFDFAWDPQDELQEEPGENPGAPYHDQHMIADIVERIYIQEARSYNRGTHKRRNRSCDNPADTLNMVKKGAAHLNGTTCRT